MSKGFKVFLGIVVVFLLYLVKFAIGSYCEKLAILTSIKRDYNFYYDNGSNRDVIISSYCSAPL